MKTILLSCLICFAFSNLGPAANEKHSNYETFCNDNNDAESLSECVDLNLYDADEKRYYDRCCFIRSQQLGGTSKGCQALTEDEYLDIVETKRKFEEKADLVIKEKVGEGYHTKIYQIDCSSSYIKFLTIATILLAMLY